MKALLIAIILVAAAATGAPRAQAPAGSWLDQATPKGWNSPGGKIPEAPVVKEGVDEDRAALLERCKLEVNKTTPSESAIAAAGWIPFRMFGDEIVKGDVEIVGGMAGADGMCRPGPFNAFVFVNGRFAGTLSPTPMMSRLDGSIGMTRLPADEVISAEFARYRAEDPLCCPSSRVTVRYRIDRPAAGPVVIPQEVRREK